MKLSISAVFLFIVTLYISNVESKITLDELKGMIERIGMQKCIKKSGVSKAILKNTLKGEFPPDRPLGCYFKCILEKMKVMKDDKMLPDYMIQQIHVMMYDELIEKLTSMVNHCLGQLTKTDGCELALEGVRCWYETDKEMYFFP